MSSAHNTTSCKTTFQLVVPLPQSIKNCAGFLKPDMQYVSREKPAKARMEHRMNILWTEPLHTKQSIPNLCCSHAKSDFSASRYVIVHASSKHFSRHLHTPKLPIQRGKFWHKHMPRWTQSPVAYVMALLQIQYTIAITSSCLSDMTPCSQLIGMVQLRTTQLHVAIHGNKVRINKI